MIPMALHDFGRAQRKGSHRIDKWVPQVDSGLVKMILAAHLEKDPSWQLYKRLPLIRDGKPRPEDLQGIHSFSGNGVSTFHLP